MFAFNRCQLCTKRAVKVRNNTDEKTVQHCTPWAVIFARQVRAGRGAVKASRVYRPVNVCRSIICEQMFHAQLRRILGHFDGMNSAGSEISGRYRGCSCTYLSYAVTFIQNITAALDSTTARCVVHCSDCSLAIVPAAAKTVAPPVAPTIATALALNITTVVEPTAGCCKAEAHDAVMASAWQRG